MQPGRTGTTGRPLRSTPHFRRTPIGVTGSMHRPTKLHIGRQPHDARGSEPIRSRRRLEKHRDRRANLSRPSPTPIAARPERTHQGARLALAELHHHGSDRGLGRRHHTGTTTTPPAVARTIDG